MFRVALGVCLALVLGVAAAYAADEEPYSESGDRVAPSEDWKVERHNAIESAPARG